MRKELKELHHRLGSTMIYVTHDQIEALTLADRMVVMKDGYVQQIGTPVEVYKRPSNLFVANFIGTPPMNIFKGIIDQDGLLEIDGVKMHIESSKIYPTLKDKNYFGKEIIVGVRPENFKIGRICDNEDHEGFKTTVQLYELLGAEALVHVRFGGKNVILKINSREVYQVDETVLVSFDPSHIYFFDKETEVTIHESC